ncbi:hypothetical protein [Streptosporangium carneum]|uniref:hypothetical protein n=1 Tax=Streptosporangium carneum TaxID=47481 RepID=UPI0022F2CBF5|nr:hypothetical protein [Streptosporangium carneum]
MYKKTLTAALAAAALTGLAAAPAAAESTAAVTIRVEYAYSQNVWEGMNVQFNCPTNQVLTGRSHSGDENGKTTYYCSAIYINDQQVQVSPGDWDTGQRENKSIFVAPANQVLTGRWHTGDENGYTKYRTAALYWQGKQVRLTSSRWTGTYKESHHYWEAAPGQVMTGRSHSGDENGNTTYRYSTVTFEG